MRMLKHLSRLKRAGLILLAFLVGAVATYFLLRALGLPAYTKYCYENAGHETCATDHITLVAIWQFGKILQWISPVAEAVAAGALTIVTWRLVALGREQSKTTRAQLRAYVDVIPRGIAQLEDKPGYVAHLAFVNRGNLPARKLRAVPNIKWSNSGDLDFPEVEVGEVSIILLPKTKAEQGTEPPPTKTFPKSPRSAATFMFGVGLSTTMDSGRIGGALSAIGTIAKSRDRFRYHHRYNDGD
jgi:hypothetical protein